MKGAWQPSIGSLFWVSAPRIPSLGVFITKTPDFSVNDLNLKSNSLGQNSFFYPTTPFTCPRLLPLVQVLLPALGFPQSFLAFSFASKSALLAFPSLQNLTSNLLCWESLHDSNMDFKMVCLLLWVTLLISTQGMWRKSKMKDCIYSQLFW